MLALENRKRLSVGTWGAGSFHGTLPSSRGAEVIDMADPARGGNPLRSMGSRYLDDAQEDNESGESTLHNKKSIALDIRTQEGKEVFF